MKVGECGMYNLVYYVINILKDIQTAFHFNIIVMSVDKIVQSSVKVNIYWGIFLG
jgi:hypothetical protein